MKKNSTEAVPMASLLVKSFEILEDGDSGLIELTARKSEGVVVLVQTGDGIRLTRAQAEALLEAIPRLLEQL